MVTVTKECSLMMFQASSMSGTNECHQNPHYHL
jgi:hypothetical protein